jgi:hypothetical protein
MARAIETRSCTDICSMTAKYVHHIKIHCQLIQLNDDDAMRVQHGKKLCREFENGQTYIHDVSPAH